MGFDDGQIILDHANGAYYAGQTVYGRMVFSQGKEKTIHGIYADMKGFCKVHWTTTETRRENDRTRYITINHDSYEEYFRNKKFLIGNDNGTHHLKEGQHEFMFNFTIPMNCPSSFEGSDGHIRYRVKVVMVTSGMFSMNKDKWVAVRVHAPLDLNQDLYCREPLEYDLSNSYCCWCVNSGYSEVTVRIPVAGYCPGQVIPMEVTCKNESTVEIEEIKFAIKKDVKFLAVSQPGTRIDHDTVAEIKKGPIPGNTTRNWTVEMEVPAMDIYNVRSCSFIDIDYTFKVSTEAEGCHDGTEETRPIIFGTIPLVGFQDNVQNPLHDQLPSVEVQNVNSYPPPPIINQPLADPSYNKGTFNPSNSPFPGNPGFPTNPNIGGSTSPYYPGNQPYPSVSPYPGANPPYPGANPPYPGANSPYPGANPPYPPGNLVSPHDSNPNSVPPYPGANPSPGMPYPEARTSPVPPYHAGVSPLKTGAIGFGIPEGDGSKMPLLPMGANVPYQASPYATASAPEPSTPGDDEQKVPLDVSSEPPPYNPEFMKNPDKKDENEKDQKNEKDHKNEKDQKTEKETK